MEWMREQGSPTRRHIVASAAAGAGALLAGKLAWAQAVPSPGRIDLHQHYFPPAFLDAQRAVAVGQNRSAAVGAALEGWSKARTIEAMDRYGIAVGILSISTPGPWFGNIEESTRLARECNEYAAEMIRDLRWRDVAGGPVACAGLRRVEPPQGGSLLPSWSRRLVAAVLRQCCFRRSGRNGGDAARDDASDHEPPVQWHAVAQPGYPLHLYQCGRHGADAFGPDRRGDQAPWRRVRQTCAERRRMRTQEAFLRGLERDLADKPRRRYRARTAVADRLW